MQKKEALKKLNSLLKELSHLPKFDPESDSENSNFTKWFKKVHKNVEKIFEGKDTYHIEELKNIPFKDIPITHMSSHDDYLIKQTNAHYQGRGDIKILLESFIESVNEWEPTSEEKAIISIKELIENINMLKNMRFKRFEVNPELDKFKARAIRTIEKIYGKNSDEVKKFKKISFLYTGSRGIYGIQVPQDTITYQEGLVKSKTLLDIVLEEIQEEGLKSIKDQEEVESIIFNGHNNEVSMEGYKTKQTIVNGHNNTFVKQSEKELDKTKVFIVHGHDELAIAQVSEVIRKLNLKPIVLKDESSQSNTVIEKIEKHTENVGFGIILYTPCDEGKNKKEETLKNRARQNVVLEHGYLMAKIGRNNTFALVKDKVETPGDISGMVYTKMDDNKAWSYALAKELKESGYKIDMNLL